MKIDIQERDFNCAFHLWSHFMKMLDDDMEKKANFKFNEDIDYRGLWRKRQLDSSLIEAVVFIAKINKKNIGIATVNIYNDVYKESLDKYKYAIIKDFVVKEEYRNKQVGHQLMKKVIDKCNDQDVFSIELGVVGGNERALKFYEDNGFKVNTYQLRMQLK